MSTPAVLAPTVVLGQAVLLPQYGRVDLAYTELFQPPTPAAGAAFVHVVPGGQVEVPQSVFFSLVTNGTVVNRTVFVDYKDESGAVVFRHLMNGSQPQSTTWNYSFILNAGGSYNVASRGIAPLAFAVLAEGYAVSIGVQSLQAGDQLAGIAYTAQLIPTGPPIDSAPIEPAATPTLG